MDYLQREIIKGLKRDGGPFDPTWVKQAHELLILLLSVRTRDPIDEWKDFANLFQEGKARALSESIWPTRKTDAVLRDWRRHRDMTREMVRARQPVDWLRIGERYPRDLVDRALRTPPEKADKYEIHRPMDVVWIALTYGLVNEIDYRECATEGCERFAAVSFPKRAGRQPRYCAVCGRNTSDRDLQRHLKKKSDNDKKCWEIVRRASERMPKKERAFVRDEDRRVLANRLFKLVKKDLARIPGKRGARWIAKKLNEEKNNEQR